MSRGAKIAIVVVIVLIVLVAVIAISQPKPVRTITNEQRLAAIPADAVKQTPATDLSKPVVLSDLWNQPVPMSDVIDSAGAEDSPYITDNGTWFFFFFTPDVRVPVEKQLLDGVTGIWWSQKVGGTWTPPTKLVLSDDLSMDGAEAIVGTRMWFASVRAGNLGEIDVYTADYIDGRWTDVKNAGRQLNVDYDIGEFHMMPDGETLYFHKGSASTNTDLYVTHWDGSAWSTPEPISDVNTAGWEGYPYVTADGSELWFTSWSKHGYEGPAIFRSVKQANGTWGEPEEIVSNFAGESSLDSQGNIYFVHHYYSADDEMIEADIYLATKK